MKYVHHDKKSLYVNVGIIGGDLTFVRSKYPTGYELEVIIDGAFPACCEMPIGILLDEDFGEDKWKDYKKSFKSMSDEQTRAWAENLVYKIEEELAMAGAEPDLFDSFKST
jgi:hypothetical protein